MMAWITWERDDATRSAVPCIRVAENALDVDFPTSQNPELSFSPIYPSSRPPCPVAAVDDNKPPILPTLTSTTVDKHGRA